MSPAGDTQRPQGQPVITLPSPAELDDLAVLTGRAKRLDAEGAMRLQCADGHLATWVCVVQGAGVLGDGTVLGLRVARASATAPVDTVVPLAAVTDRLAARGADTTDFSVPPSEVRAGWASISPPRGGWEPVARIDEGDLAAVARAGIEEVTAGAPEGSGAAAVADLRRRVWATGVGVGWPRGLAFGAHALGFLGDGPEAVLWRVGPWWRLSTERGHVLAR
ncbi:hypothetical protein [Kytococcus sedentarius]|uniref:hypothetical protein n=1 Tax=Kytococcus sedentarius TaxID=1276 RepID=UPI0035BC6787